MYIYSYLATQTYIPKTLKCVQCCLLVLQWCRSSQWSSLWLWIFQMQSAQILLYAGTHLPNKDC